MVYFRQAINTSLEEAAFLDLLHSNTGPQLFGVPVRSYEATAGKLGF